MTDGTVYRIKPKGTNDCLTYGSNKKLSLQPCSDADEGQKWANKGGATNFQLIRGTNACLNKNGKVSECKNTDVYKWNKTENSQLKSKHKGNKCLQKKGTSRNVEMAGCNNTQKWDMEAVVAGGPPPPSASPEGSPSPSSASPGSPSSTSPAGATTPSSSSTTPTPSPSGGDKKFWETTWFFWSAIGGGAFIVLSIILCVVVIAMSGGQASHHHPW